MNKTILRYIPVIVEIISAILVCIGIFLSDVPLSKRFIATGIVTLVLGIMIWLTFVLLLPDN